MHPHRARMIRDLGLTLALVALWPMGTRAQAPMDFNPLPACRMWDTRNPPGPSGGPKLAANTIRCFPVSGMCGLPSVSRAIVFNAAAAAPTEGGTLRFFPDGQPPTPGHPSFSFKAGTTTSATGLVLRMMDASRICVRVEMPSGSTGLVHNLTDTVGYYDGPIGSKGNAGS